MIQLRLLVETFPKGTSLIHRVRLKHVLIHSLSEVVSS